MNTGNAEYIPVSILMDRKIGHSKDLLRNWTEIFVIPYTVGY